MHDQKRFIVRTGLLALLIVLLTVLMLSISGKPSTDAYNTRTITQLQQYVTVFELLRLEKGTYPITVGAVCLGDYDDDSCWDKEGTGVKEDPQFNDELAKYVPLLSSGRLVKDERNPDNDREGYIYRSKNKGREYEIEYLLMGKNKRCGFGTDLSLSVAVTPDSENTHCVIAR